VINRAGQKVELNQAANTNHGIGCHRCDCEKRSTTEKVVSTFKK